MKKLIYVSAAILSVVIPGNSLAGQASSGMADVDFKQFVCTTLEAQPNRKKALLEIITQVGSIISENQKDTLLDIKDSEIAAENLCFDVTQ